MPTPTHAGGVVIRNAGADTLYLLVTALGKPDEWTLPKGHINPGETPENAAVREIREEAGVVGEISCLVGMSEFFAKGEQAHVNYYLINYLQSISDPEPNRQITWCNFGDALRRLTFAEAKDIVQKVYRIITP